MKGAFSVYITDDSNKVLVWIDSESYSSKPQGNEITNIRNRSKRGKAKAYTIDELKNALQNGQTIIAADYHTETSSTNSSQKHFVCDSKQLFFIDVDNDKQYITRSEAIALAKNQGIEPILHYETFSSTPNKEKFRLVFMLETAVDGNKATICQNQLLKIFDGYADPACRDLCRLFYGTNTNVTIEPTAKLIPISWIQESEPKKESQRFLNANNNDNNNDYHQFWQDNRYDLLKHIPADDYNNWITVGMGLKNENEPFDLFNEWSQNSTKYKGREDCQRKWESFTRPDGITAGTIVKLAQDNGWKPPKKSFLSNNNNNHPQEFQYNNPKKDVLTLALFKNWCAEQNIIIRYDVITHKNEVKGLDGGIAEIRDSISDVIIYDRIKSTYKCNKQLITDLIKASAADNPYNPVLDMLNSAPKWDGIDREAELFKIMRLPEDDILSRKLIHKWLLQSLCLLSNNSESPISSDGVLVLNGPQGIGKTLLTLRLAVQPKFVKTGIHLNFNDKDSLIRATSAWITELGELESTLRTDIESLKALITESVDRYRVPYGYADRELPRRTSFLGTCNSEQFLIDQTGSRRFWTIPCEEHFDIDALLNFDTLQLWKQVETWLKNGESYRLTSNELTELAKRNCNYQKLIKAQQEIKDILANYEASPQSYVMKLCTTSDIKEEYSSLSRYTAEQIGKALKAEGYERKNGPRDISGRRKKGYYFPIPKSFNIGQYGSKYSI